uniref:Sulfotransfer_1 domain-containing protein n=1 Tax=Parastrongyloides trichosuri TaxID=131310 RepID=A0A0N4ZRN5_PARTI
MVYFTLCLLILASLFKDYQFNTNENVLLLSSSFQETNIETTILPSVSKNNNKTKKFKRGRNKGLEENQKKIKKTITLVKNITLINESEKKENKKDTLSYKIIEKNKKITKIKNTFNRKNLNEKELLPNYLNHTCELFTKETPCIPPFQKFHSRFRVDVSHHVNYCTITKNFSSMLRAILCFIKKPHYVKYQKDISKAHWTYKFCNDNNFSRTISRVAANHTNGNIEKLMTTWKHVAFVRDPYERFISAFVDKCVVSKEWLVKKDRCYGCKSNITCVLERMYKKMKEKTTYPGKTFEVTYDDVHFFPQSWHCEFKKRMSSYIIIKYGSEPKVLKNFYIQFFKFLKERGISRKKIQYIRKYTEKKRTRHATYNLWVRKYFDRKVQKNKHLMELMYRMFYYDYVAFNFPLPPIP